MIKVLTKRPGTGPAKATIIEEKLQVLSVKMANLQNCGAKNCPD
jgi:hypothetical protein